MLDPMDYLKNRLFRKRLPVKDVFALFKKVLDSDNHALEVIGEMGDKLGGDYIFDVVYIKDAHARLASALEQSISSFDQLTQGRYPKLKDVFVRIDEGIRTEIEGPGTASSFLVMQSGDITQDNSRDVGGKGSALAELKNRAGVRVPEFFAITTRAFDAFMKHNGYDLKLSNAVEGEDEGKDLEALRALIEGADIPEELGRAIDAALDNLKGGGRFLAVRSSAEEEDGEFSFAGQFTTVLNVPPDSASVKAAYRKVAASLYSPGAVAYQRWLGYSIESMKMAVCCVEMVDAVASGVVFTASPDGDRARLIITAALGLGVSVVDGTVDADIYTVTKPGPDGGSPVIASRKSGRKTEMVASLPGGGTGVLPVAAENADSFCLTDKLAAELAVQALTIEKHFGGPQDIEWSLGRDGAIYVLQARPLRVDDDVQEKRAERVAAPDAHVLMSGRGTPVQHGAGAGPVFMHRRESDLDHVPEGAVLVSPTDSSGITRVMPRLSAIITDVGGLTSHMASVCREFRIPALVGAGDATRTLREGQPVTLYIDEDGKAVVYEGVVRELVDYAQAEVFGMESVGEFRKKRRILRRVSPLNLIDPLMDDFVPEGCRTVHDVLRFMHEKSVAELVESAKNWGEQVKGRAPVRIDLPIPAGIMVIDIGGGLREPGAKNHVSVDDIQSLPLKAIISGMTHPGVWHSDIVSLNAGDFMSSMMRMPDIRANAGSYAGYNVAVASREYVNLSLRFGYHFNMLDCYMSENARDNHIYFRFTGGATDITKRSRRIHLISIILEEFGFNTKTRGDLIIARLSNITSEKMGYILDHLGRLVSFARQMDAMLQTEDDVERYAKNFMEGVY